MIPVSFALLTAFLHHERDNNSLELNLETPKYDNPLNFGCPVSRKVSKLGYLNLKSACQQSNWEFLNLVQSVEDVGTFRSHKAKTLYKA